MITSEEPLVVCQNCGKKQRYTGENNRIGGKGHRTKTPFWRGHVIFHRENELIRKLASGPKTRSELTRYPRGDITELIDRLEPPTARGTRKSRPVPREMVFYLYGDDRAAVRKFIEVNEAYVEDVLSDKRNPLQSNWEQYLYEMLIQQWQWRDTE